MTMTVAEAAEILHKHNDWRRGEGAPFQNMGKPKDIGEAIDVAVAFMTGGNNEMLAREYINQSGMVDHASDCATSNAPAYVPNKCDCHKPQLIDS